MAYRDDLVRRATEYTQRHMLRLSDELGCGMHGIVYMAESQRESPRSAIKVFARQVEYARERDVYFRLEELGIKTIRGCQVPRLMHYDEALLIIEMSIVTRPFVLDFAGAYLDDPPDFSDEVLADWRVEKQEQFGAQWGEVQAILRHLEGHGIYMVDVNPGNISFG